MQRIVNQLLTKKYYVVYLYHKDRNSPHIKKEEATMKKKNLYGYFYRGTQFFGIFCFCGGLPVFLYSFG